MLIIDNQKFFQIISKFKIKSYSQTEGWLSFCDFEEKGNIIFLVDEILNPQIACYGHVKKALGFKMLLMEGPCIKSEDYKYALIKGFYDEITKLDFDMVEINSSIKYKPEYEIGIRRAGYLRPVGFFSIQLSNWINLQENLHYNSNWKRNIKKSEDYNLSFEVQSKPTKEKVKEVVDFYNSFTKEKGISHQLYFTSTYNMLQSNDFSLGIVYDSKSSMTSCIIFHYNDQHAGLLYAAKNNQAKDSGATFFMYNQLLELLKTRGLKTFDMEKLQPSTHSTDGVFLFKDGIKGEHIVYNGEWCWYKKSIYRLMMYFVKKYLMKKSER